MLTRPHRQEALSRAYIHAIAARAGLGTSIPTPDYGIDLTLHGIAILGRRRIESSYKLDVQAKCTTLASREVDHVRYDLARKDYDCLRLVGAGTPRILVVLVLPAREADWVTQTEEELVLRRCAYWLPLKGQPPRRNRRAVRVRIPFSNRFSVEGLQSLMDTISRGGEP
jgi:hypothetical protein